MLRTQVLTKALTDINILLQKCASLHSNEFEGGKMRSLRGELIEQFVRDTINYVGVVTNINLVAKQGFYDKKELRLTNEIKKHHQVDVHVYLNNNFIAAIECKAYLDSCYYIRACDDFLLFKKFNYNIRNSIFALENAIDDNTMVFTNHCKDNICEKSFFMMDGKRQSSKPVYDSKFMKPINEKAMADFIDYIFELTQ